MDSDSPELRPPKSAPARILIACVRCKGRKIRCDGQTPSCANCVAGGAECAYAPGRRYRGPAKKKTDTEKQVNQGHESSSSRSLEDPTAADAFLLQIPIHLRPRTQRFRFLDYLLVYGKHLETWRTKADANDPSRTRTFAPLMPRDVAVSLMEHCFAETMVEYQVLEQTEFMKLLEAQYAVSSTEPAAGFARWAIVNTITALAIRVKTAPGSETDFSHIADTLYRNATIVLPELILQDPCELSIQALLTMAMFAGGIPDAKACMMLASNASRHMDLVTLTSPASDPQLYIQLYAVARALENAAVLGCHVPLAS
ncbi:hypothetical protein CONLIGDRAFT_677223 [Coniochaeta ligniaria NRRL 30616]|uniref:Zn(2)-C6 fungal-type domain-containing protein n=1 Tax=Coniochaeta ligniaria NRRL 30616 TaxID=1408157 RepID=A0A1J7J225_9PEZI|nr:hypothetical protein CONLIGDRAFT_677223 [Coniochaeta ligniaria NRRL 30616]